MRYLAFILLFAACTSAQQSSVNSPSNSKILKNSDFAYEPNIRTILLHPSGSRESILLPAVTQLNQSDLLLEFDDLNTQRENYYAKIIHCNYDWSKSALLDLDFIREFNEFPINNFEFSVDSHVPYIHYWLTIPQVKLPGNYLIIVYRNGDKSDLVLSKRFMVFDPQVTFENERNLIGAGSIAAMNQQINFTINYQNLEIINPLGSVQVALRQNQRWDNMVTDLKPSFVRETEKQIEYRFFDENNMFKGGSEFRFFDLRSLAHPGRNVASVNRNLRPYEVYIEKDKPRTTEAYSQYRDYNGGFILDNFDYRDAAFSNYAYVNFALASKPIPGNVYVTGAFSYWDFNKENKMSYDSVRKEYQATLLLKQGWYDYQYVVKSDKLPPYHFEGSHFETENAYEIFVYYRPFKPQADLLIGYIRIDKNRR